MKMLSDEKFKDLIENVTIGIVVTLIVAIFFGFICFAHYQDKQIENKKIEYCREMKIQPKDCK